MGQNQTIMGEEGNEFVLQKEIIAKGMFGNIRKAKIINKLSKSIPAVCKEIKLRELMKTGESRGKILND